MSGSTRGNGKGRQLAYLAISLDLCLHNDGKPTFRRGTSNCSCVNLTFLSRDIFARCHWFTEILISGSDHIPGSTTLRLFSQPVCASNRVTRTDWAVFCRALDDTTSEINDPEDFKDVIGSLQQAEAKQFISLLSKRLWMPNAYALFVKALNEGLDEID